MRLNSGPQLFRIQLSHHEHFLRHRAFAGHQLVATPDWGGHPQLQRLAAAAHTADHGWRDGLYSLLFGQTLQPGNQSINVSAVGNDDPAQISNKP